MNRNKNSRREFGFRLAALSSVGLAVCQTQSALADRSSAGQQSLEVGAFRSLLGERFMISDGQSTFLARLEDVRIVCSKQTCRPDSLNRKSAFSILFDAVDGQLKEQAVCRVTHPQLCEQEMFLVPVNGSSKVEAVFA